MEKKCNICNSVKNIEDFYKNQTRCKLCTKKYALDNKENIKARKKKYRQENKEFISENDKKYYSENKKIINIKHSNYYLENIEKIKEIQKEYRLNNKEILLNKGKEYSKKYRNKKKLDPLFRLKSNLRGSLRSSLLNKKFTKRCKTEDILGMSFVDFKLYLESKFEPWMNWGNQGKYKSGELNYGWDIDHIIPLDSANTEEEILKLNHYTNLQPLCSYINRNVKMYKQNYY